MVVSDKSCKLKAAIPGKFYQDGKNMSGNIYPTKRPVPVNILRLIQLFHFLLWFKLKSTGSEKN